MESNQNEKIVAFDSLYTTNHIQLLKILLPRFSPPLQKNLTLFIKFLELRYTISFLNAYPYAIKGCHFDKAPPDWDILHNDLFPYLTPGEAEKMKQLQKSLSMMKQFSSIQKNLEALKDILPEEMDIESMFQNIMGNMDGNSPSNLFREMSNYNSSEDTVKTPRNHKDSSAETLNTVRDNNSSPENILKNMMSDSQMDLFRKFNEKFQNI